MVKTEIAVCADGGDDKDPLLAPRLELLSYGSTSSVTD